MSQDFSYKCFENSEGIAELKNLFDDIGLDYEDFYERFHDKEYSEMMLLLLSIWNYLKNFERIEDQNVDTVIFLLTQTGINEDDPCQQSNLDKLLNEVYCKFPGAKCLQMYKSFKRANVQRQNCAIVNLYKYLMVDRFLEFDHSADKLLLGGELSE